MKLLSRLRPSDLKVVFGAAMGLSMRTVSIVLGLIQIPILLAYLGQEAYGLFLVLGQFAAWIALADPGMANSLISLLAQSEATDDKTLAQQAFSTACFFLFALALAGWLVISGVLLIAPVEKFFRITDPALIEKLPWLVFAAMALPVLSILASVVPKAYLACQEHRTSTLIHILGMLAGFGAVVWVTHSALGLPAVLLITGLVPTAVALVLFVLLVGKRPFLKPKWSMVSLSLGKSMLSVGARIMLLQIFWLMLSGIGEFVVSSHLGVSANASFGTAMKVGNYVNTLPALLYSYLWPAYSTAYARGDIPWIRKRFVYSTAFVVVMNFCAFVLLAMFGDRLIAVWTRGKLEIPANVWLWMIPWGVIVCFISQINCLCNATGRLNGLLVAAGLAAGLNCLLANHWVKPFGLSGVLAAASVAGGIQVLLSFFPVRAVFSGGRTNPATGPIIST